MALLSLSLSLSACRSATKFSRRAAQHPLWAALRRRRQKAEQADRGLPPPSGGGEGDLVLSLSSGLALLLSRSPSRLLVGSSATKFSRPAAQHPAPIFGWPAAQKRQKAERADQGLPAHLLQGGRDLVLSPSSGLALLSLPLPLSLSATKFSRLAAQHPLWAGLRRRRQKAEQADRGLPPRLLLQGGGG